MTFMRWLPTFLAFPVGGAVAITTVGTIDTPLKAAAGGLLAGAVIGLAQWLALRPSRRWIGYTAAAVAAGSALSAAITGSGTELADVVLTGAITGTVVGVAQSALLGRDRALWTAVSAGGWALGWLATWLVIVDIERGYAMFGSSGALVVTLLTGLALRLRVAA
jgi:hypothetical protein